MTTPYYDAIAIDKPVPPTKDERNTFEFSRSTVTLTFYSLRSHAEILATYAPTFEDSPYTIRVKTVTTKQTSKTIGR